MLFDIDQVRDWHKKGNIVYVRSLWRHMPDEAHEYIYEPCDPVRIVRKGEIGDIVKMYDEGWYGDSIYINWGDFKGKYTFDFLINSLYNINVGEKTGRYPKRVPSISGWKDFFQVIRVE
jgi:hypothetical protein